MLALGTPAPDFALPDTQGVLRTRNEFLGGPAFAVFFICNHCPYVKHLREGLAAFGRDYAAQGIAVVAINANDTERYPDDSPEAMKREHALARYPFPYLYDASQEVAKAYRAACTPDLYLFDGEGKLAYRGQFDASRPGNGKPVTGEDFRAACDAVLVGTDVPAPQLPSVGCNIKWRPGNEPDYF